MSHVNKTLGGLRTEGNTVQCLRFVGNRQKVIISLDRWAHELPPAALELLTQEEQTEWRHWKIAHEAAFRKKQLTLALAAAPAEINAAATALREQAALPADPAALWSAIDALTDELEKSGLPREPRPRGRPRKS